MHRFFVPPSSIAIDKVTFPPEISRQMNLVLRLKPGVSVIALDGLGNEYTVLMQEVNSANAVGSVTGSGFTSAEPKTRLTLLLCLTQREKFEWILQKCTEVGVSVIVPVISSRSLVQTSRDVESKSERWQRILREAAEQSHRGKVPVLKAPMKFVESLHLEEISRDLRLIPWEEVKAGGIREALQWDTTSDVTLLIGPEGGFSADEVNAAKKAGFLPVSLGPRILRMETAAVTAAAIVLYQRGDMDMGSDQTSG
jgi:16S rRNA (uracil1498-N3)-methyltransferase